jgi:hypothetical protein
MCINVIQQYSNRKLPVMKSCMRKIKDFLLLYYKNFEMPVIDNWVVIHVHVCKILTLK